MTAPAIDERVELDLFFQTKEAARFDLLDGRLVEREASDESSRIALRIARLLGNVVEPARLGNLYGADCGIRIFADPIETRHADVSFVSAARVVPGTHGYLRTPPDLAVEVVSPGDRAARLRQKVDLWLDNGVRLVWVAYPEEREVHVYRASGPASILGPDAEITGEDVIPGFAATVRDLFPD